MHTRTIALAGCLALAATAAWADDPMASTYANTVTTKNTATGDSATLLFSADGTYTAKGMQNGQAISYNGNWVLKDGGKTICLTPQAPPNATAAPQASCSPLAAHNVGDSWTITNDQNQTFQVSITAGR